MNTVSISIIFLSGLILGWMLSAVSNADPKASVSAKELEAILRAYEDGRDRDAHYRKYSDTVSNSVVVERDI